MAGTSTSRTWKSDQLVEATGGHAEPGSGSSGARRHCRSDAAWSVRYRRRLVQRPAARSARATESASASEGAREKLASDTREPADMSKSHGRACNFIDLVSSSSTDDTPSVFTENEVLTSSLFFTGVRTPYQTPKYSIRHHLRYSSTVSRSVIQCSLIP